MLDLANLRGAWPLDENNTDELKHTMEALNHFLPQYPDVLDDAYIMGVLVLRGFLRKAWDATDARQRDWYTYEFRSFAQKMTARVKLMKLVRSAQDVPPQLPLILPASFREAAEFTAQSEPSELSELEAIGFYFLPRFLRRAKRCANSGCQVLPYFFAKKNSRKFCSDTCSIPTQREAKLRWWNKNRRNKTKAKGAVKWKPTTKKSGGSTSGKR